MIDKRAIAYECTNSEGTCLVYPARKRGHCTPLFASPEIPDGYVLVLKIVTKEMMNAMCGAIANGASYQTIWDEAIKAANAGVTGA